MKPTALTLTALAMAAGLAACSPKADKETAASPAPTPAPAAPGAMGDMTAAPPVGKAARGAGTVTAVDAAAGTITINHEPIPEAGWPAMTMGFKASAEQVKSVKVGDRVAFDLTLTGGGGEITAISKGSVHRTDPDIR